MRIMRSAFVGLALLATACGGSETPEGAETEGGDVAQYEGAIASADVEQGAEQFALFCDDCHPDGEEDVGPSLIANPTTPAMMRKQIREGSGKMRPIPAKRLSDEDMEAVLAYLASINAIK